MFATRWNRNPVQKDKNNGKRKIEVAGYIPANVRIENMIDAGRRLIEARAEQYDYKTAQEVPEDGGPLDPTRNPNYDLADVTMAAQYLDPKLKEASKKAKELKAAEEEKVFLEKVDKAAEEKVAAFSNRPKE